jgi:hypothetical protein
MAQHDECERLFSLGLIGPQEYKRLKSRAARRRFDEEQSRAGDGVAPSGAVSSGEINDKRYQGDSAAWGPQDAGDIDSRANKRAAPKQTLIRSQPQRDRKWPTVAEVQAMSAYQYNPTWFGENT